MAGQAQISGATDGILAIARIDHLAVNGRTELNLFASYPLDILSPADPPQLILNAKLGEGRFSYQLTRTTFDGARDTYSLGPFENQREFRIEDNQLIFPSLELSRRGSVRVHVTEATFTFPTVNLTAGQPTDIFYVLGPERESPPEGKQRIVFEEDGTYRYEILLTEGGTRVVRSARWSVEGDVVTLRFEGSSAVTRSRVSVSAQRLKLGAIEYECGTIATMPSPCPDHIGSRVALSPSEIQAYQAGRVREYRRDS